MREKLNMGATHVTVTIRNPAAPERAWQALFLVDTGATDSLVPRDHLESIGLNPKGQRTYELADGHELKMDITTGDIEFMGRNRRRDDHHGRTWDRTNPRCHGTGICRHRSRPAKPDAQTPARRAAEETGGNVILRSVPLIVNDICMAPAGHQVGA